MAEPEQDRAWVSPERQAVSAALARAGIAAATNAITMLERDDRFAARLPDDRMAWFPINAKGAARMARERRVLELIAKHCSFRAPRILHEAPEGWDLRNLVPGAFDAFRTFERAKAEPIFAATLGAAMGRVLADQHLSIPREALSGWLPLKPSWPEPFSYVEERLPRVTEDAALIEEALSLLRRHEAAEVEVTDRVLTHSDFGFHNMIINEETAWVEGVFDYDDAAFADRHHDFKYLILDAADEPMLRSAIETYVGAGGAAIDIERVNVLNAASALCFIAFRAGAAPDERPAGRTLEEDMRWTRSALSKVC